MEAKGGKDYRTNVKKKSYLSTLKWGDGSDPPRK